VDLALEVAMLLSNGTNVTRNWSLIQKYEPGDGSPPKGTFTVPPSHKNLEPNDRA
jgi:hypothetical protein